MKFYLPHHELELSIGDTISVSDDTRTDFTSGVIVELDICPNAPAVAAECGSCHNKLISDLLVSSDSEKWVSKKTKKCLCDIREIKIINKGCTINKSSEI